MCGEERPEDYKVPDIYQPDQQEVIRIQQEELAVMQYEQVTRGCIQESLVCKSIMHTTVIAEKNFCISAPLKG